MANIRDPPGCALKCRLSIVVFVHAQYALWFGLDAKRAYAELVFFNYWKLKFWVKNFHL
jgi:hypothetical protein